jgi:acyl-CoA reductase-like NAD-dependent aldehyde dehydrogenase
MSTERVIVHESLAAELEEALREAVQTIKDRKFDLIRPSAVEELKSVVEEAVESVGSNPSFEEYRTDKQGARLITPEPTISGTTASPIILASVPKTSPVYQNESFAPLLTLITAADTADAVSIANSHPAGLSSAIFTSDIGLALTVAKKLEVGAVHINGMTVHDQHTLPFGGVRDSGWGKFNGRGAIEAFTRTKTVRLGIEGHMLPLEAL